MSSISKEKWLLRVILYSFFLSLLSFGVFMLKDNGVYLLENDFKAQQVDMNMAVNNLIRNGFSQWSWNYGLGTQTIGAYSFYVNFPIPYIAFLFKSSFMPYLIGWFYIIRFTLASVTAYFYIYYNIRNYKAALIGGILYSFSGYQIVNLVFHFSDVILLFPLLMLSFDYMMHSGKKKWYIICVFLLCLCDYYMFVAEAVFLVIYFFFRYFSKIERKLITIVECIYTSLIGIALSSIIFVPSILHIMSNSRTRFDINNVLSGFGFRPFLNVFKGMVLPAEPMGMQSCVSNFVYDSCGLYLPMIGLSYVFSYILIKKRNWLKNIILFLFCSSFVPFINMAFCMYTDKYYRWWFCLDLMISLASARIISERENDKDIKFKSGIFIYGLVTIVFIIILLAINKIIFKGTIILNLKMLISEIVLLFAGLIFLSILEFLYIRKRNFKSYYIGLITGISIFSVIITIGMNYEYQIGGDGPENHMFNEKVLLGAKLKNYNDAFRYRISDNDIIMSGNIIGCGVFGSTVSSSIRDFEDIFEFHLPQFNIDLNSIKGLNELMGAKYEVVCADDFDESVKYYDKIVTNDKTYYIIENIVSPIGFAYETYITLDELRQIDLQERGVALLGNLCIEDEDISKDITDIINKRNISGDILELTNKNIANKVIDFRRTNKGFTCNTNYSRKMPVWFSVPYDKGWRARIDGEEVAITKSAGMMAIIVEEGYHDVEFIYETPGLNISYFITIIGIILLIFICYSERNINEKKIS